jgi:hypothetical protein
MKPIESKNFEKADVGRTFPKGKIEVVTVGGYTFGRATLQPGWKWSESLKPVLKTESCMIRHNQIVVSGRLRVRMDDGTEMEFGPGDVMAISPGHDAWVVGKKPFVAIDINGLNEIAKAA